MLFITLIYVVEPSHSLLLIAPFFSRDFIALDCRIAGFFLKIGKEIGKAWLKSLTREAREPHTPVWHVRREKKKPRLSPVSLSVFGLVQDLLFDCLRVLEYAKIRTVLQTVIAPKPQNACYAGCSRRPTDSGRRKENEREAGRCEAKLFSQKVTRSSLLLVS